MPIESRVRLIKISAFLLLIGPGLMMITGPDGPFLQSINAFLDFAHQPYDGGQQITGDAGFLLTAILGGVLVGFGVMIWQVTDVVYSADPAMGRRIILISLLCWFLCDSLGSLLAGAWFNAVINTVILALFLFPLLAGQRGGEAAI